jgi:methyl-accepting chemotaxis protein
VLLIVGSTLAVIVLVLSGAFIFSRRSITRPINNIIEGLTTASDQARTASSEISSASRSMAESASQQAASIQETSASLEEMSSMTRRNADNAAEADRIMRETRKTVDAANLSMNDLTSSMAGISHSSEETFKIVKTIDEIAFQTNLLALNAAVEAARAGEAGAGFAVVADEVRNLSMRAAEAARNTAELIKDTTRKVQDGSGIVTRTNQAFGKVAEGASRVADLVSEISAASGEQAQGIEQINLAVSEMDKSIQQNTTLAEESASASEEMMAQSGQLKAIVDELRHMVQGRESDRSHELALSDEKA